eukprot:TRINITY_DN2917_c0_g2_i2.p1 TRINITY_DN2917_c0_g2~~TRINITY_DN2917_c0_g2_i2.p1  ORF type:complete len:290 (-),score=57.91 TRINITY_DN2917_c0_g2_i2:458-1327(-)
MMPVLSQRVMDEAQCVLLFSNIREIIQVSEAFAQQLSARVRSWSSAACIGDVISRTAPFFKSYMPFCSNYATALDFLRSLQKNEKFVTIVGKAQSVIGNSLESVLITPVQRVPRLQLLVQELVKATPLTHKDYPQIHKALMMVRDIAAFVNEGVRNGERLAQVVKIQQLVDTSDLSESLVRPGRSFVRDALMTSSFNGRRSRQQYFVLFTDALMCAEESGLFRSHKFKLKHMLPLADIVVQSDLTQDNIVFRHGRDQIELASDTVLETKEWLNDLLKLTTSAVHRPRLL